MFSIIGTKNCFCSKGSKDIQAESGVEFFHRNLDDVLVGSHHLCTWQPVRRTEEAQSA